MIRSVTAVGALLTAVMAVAGCASSDGVGIGHHQPGTARAHTDATSLGQPDEPIAGPQGATPQFLVECLYSHAAADDPIVYPGQPGHSHLHMFFGNTEVDAFTTVESLRNGDTTCDQPLDKAAYWAPALLRGAEVLTPVKSTAYYRPGQGVERAVRPPECARGRNLRLLVTFPDCWDGENLDSDDHHAHVAYSSRGACPPGFPVAITQLQFSVEYPVWGSTDGLLLASGAVTTGHADFMNGWDQAKLASEVQLCLHREVVCGVASGRATG